MRNFMIFSALVLSLVLISAGDVFAQKKHHSGMKCEEHYKSLDVDKDGAVTLEEFSAVRHPRGNPKEIFKQRDADNNGKLSLEEFCERGKRPEGPMGGCEDHFTSMDADKDGRLSLAEFKSGRHPRGNPEEMFKMRDADKNGFLSKEEFCKRGMRPGRDRR